MVGERPDSKDIPVIIGGNLSDVRTTLIVKKICHHAALIIKLLDVLKICRKKSSTNEPNKTNMRGIHFLLRLTG